MELREQVAQFIFASHGNRKWSILQPSTRGAWELEADKLLAIICPTIEAEARQLGRKEVVDWVNWHTGIREDSHGLVCRNMWDAEWQSQLKAWGIETERTISPQEARQRCLGRLVNKPQTEAKNE